MKHATLTAVLCLVAGAPYLAGCGGSSGTNSSGASASTSSATGKAVLKIVWPARTDATGRLIPQLSNGIQVSVSGPTKQSQNVSRPYPGSDPSQVGTIEFDNLPIGDYTIVATAYPNADCTGTAQATGYTPTTIHAGQTTQFSLTMGTTISYIRLAAANSGITLPATLNVGDTLQLVATAMNSSNQVVLANLQWTATDPNTGAPSAVASVDATGKVTALTNGSAKITVTDPETGKTATTALNIALGYTATDLGSPGLGYTFEGEAAMNDNGQIASIWKASSYDGGQIGTYLCTSAGGFTLIGGIPLMPYYSSGKIISFNDAGQILGVDPSSGGTYLYSGSSLQSLNNVIVSAYGMNGSGQIVGYGYYKAPFQSVPHGFLYSGGTVKDLGTLSHGSSSTAYGVNDSGQVVGSADTIEPDNPNATVTHAFLYDNGAMQDLPVLSSGDVYAEAYAINKSGSLVGYSSSSQYGYSGHAFLYTGGKMQSLEAGARTKPISSSASDINDNGVIIGQMDISGSGSFFSTSTAFVYSGGSMLNLNDISSGLNDITLFDVFDITKSGSILAVGDDAKGVEHLVLLTPTGGASKAVSANGHRALAEGVPTNRLPQWYLARHGHKPATGAKP